jgi:integrase
MPTLKLTERQIDKLPAPDPSGKQVLHWDSELKGFGVVCSGVTNSKSFVVQRALPDGRNRRVTIGAVNELTLAKATALAADTLHSLRHGHDPKKKIDNPTLRDTLETYLTARHDLRPASIRLYRQVCEKTLTAWLDRPMREITRDMVEDKHRAIAASISKSGVSNGEVTANVAMRIFRALYSFAADRSDNEMPPNPVQRLKKQWYKEPPRERIVPADKMKEFYDAVCALENPVQRDYLTMLMFTGMRKSECASLRWDDVDLNKRTFRIQSDKTKNGVRLELPMSDVVYDLLVARRALGIPGGGFVFPARGGGCIASTASPLKAIYEATGIQISAHDLRRGFVTIAESTNISLSAIKALVNHSLGSGVTEKYIQMSVERLREPVQQVADEIKSLCGIESVVGDNVRKLERAL